MNYLPRRSLLAIAAVVDVALHARPMPVTAKSLTARHGLPPRHLEPLLQALVHANVLKGARGLHGGYELARDRRKISIGEIVRIALALSADPEEFVTSSIMIERVVEPNVQKAVETFLDNLDAISVDDLCNEAVLAHVLDEEKAIGDFAI